MNRIIFIFIFSFVSFADEGIIRMITSLSNSIYDQVETKKLLEISNSNTKLSDFEKIKNFSNNVDIVDLEGVYSIEQNKILIDEDSFDDFYDDQKDIRHLLLVITKKFYDLDINPDLIYSLLDVHQSTNGKSVEDFNPYCEIKEAKNIKVYQSDEYKSDKLSSASQAINQAEQRCKENEKGKCRLDESHLTGSGYFARTLLGIEQGHYAVYIDEYYQTISKPNKTQRYQFYCKQYTKCKELIEIAPFGQAIEFKDVDKKLKKYCN